MSSDSNTYRIDSLEALNALYGKVNPNSLAKETSQLTAEYQRWLERAPFLAIASAGEKGLDCSPRGDTQGRLFRVLNSSQIAIPDRRGNNRLDTLRNIVVDPRVAMLFLIPGIAEALRINGKATITTDPELIKSFTVDEHTPATIILVDIEAVYFQCARALTRAKLWDPAAHASRSEVPTAGELTKSAIPDFDADTYDAELDARQSSTLY